MIKYCAKCNSPEYPNCGCWPAGAEKGRQWNQLLELQLKNVQSLYAELNDAVVGYLEMRVSYEELLPHLTLKGESESPSAGKATYHFKVNGIQFEGALEVNVDNANKEES
ncbi:MAG: hypothetical protein QOE26_2789 [Verrucomicrobiota bacterium]|jgi:hypothetical protein